MSRSSKKLALKQKQTLRARKGLSVELASQVGGLTGLGGAEQVGDLHQYPIMGAPGISTMFGWDVDSVEAALRSHSQGDFQATGLLLDDLKANPIIKHCREVRQDAFRTLPEEMVEGSGPRAAECLAFMKEVLPDIVSDEILDDWHDATLFMGESVSGMNWEEVRDGANRWWLPKIIPWHPSHTQRLYLPQLRDAEFESSDGRVMVARTKEHGPLVVEGGGGRWVHIKNGVLNPWMNGLIRSLAEPYLGDTYTLRDNLALQERFGQGVIKLFHPVEWNDMQVDASVNTVRASGSGGVISCPMTHDGKRRVDAELIKTDATGYQLFNLTERRLLRRMLISLLGQDMTTVGQTGGYAQATIHANVLWHKRERDAARFGDAKLINVKDNRGVPEKRWVPRDGVIRTQISRWIAYYNFGSFDDAPYRYWDATPPEERILRLDRELDAANKRAESLAKLAKALPELRLLLGKRLDDEAVIRLMKQCGVDPDSDMLG